MASTNGDAAATTGAGSRSHPRPEPQAGAAARNGKRAPAADHEHDFSDSGAFNINDQWATGVHYEARLVHGRVGRTKVKFTNGRQPVAATEVMNREAAVALLGERNIAAIEAAVGGDTAALRAKGRLQGAQLAFHKSYTHDRKPENIIEPDHDRQQQAGFDADVRQWVQARRRQIEQARTDQTLVAGRPTHASPIQPRALDGPADPVEDRSKAIPEQVAKRFLQVEDKYYFPDQSLAFEDRGSTLSTRSDNREVVRALVTIAHARGWHHIAVRGREDFRRSAWLEASLQGIDMRGYTPTAVEKAYLASLLERQGVARAADPQHGIAHSRARGSGDQRPTNPPARADGAPPPSRDDHRRPGALIGKLVEHGAAHYAHDAKNEHSYFVKVETPAGMRTVWGVDLERAVKQSRVAVGENVAVAKLGSKPVTATERIFDEQGRPVGARVVDTHRNRWSVGSLDKAAAFANRERDDVVKKHPELAPAYGTIAAARKFAEREWPGSEDIQDRFVAMTKEVVADKIAYGEPVPAPKIRAVREPGRPPQPPREKSRETDNER